MIVRLLTVAACALMLTAPMAPAYAFEKVASRDVFVSLIQGKALTRFGIKLDVTTQGDIIGRAFGRDVTGAWNWKDSYFCRSLYWGARDLGDNCQEVRIDGDTIRFTSDQGSGDFADLTLR